MHASEVGSQVEPASINPEPASIILLAFTDGHADGRSCCLSFFL